MKLLCYPPIITHSDTTELSDLVYRLAWHFNSSSYQIDIITNCKGPQDLIPIDYLAKSLFDLACENIEKKIINFLKEEEINIDEYEIILLHNSDFIEKIRNQTYNNVKLVNVDRRTVQYATSLLLKLTSNDGRGSIELNECYYHRFKTLVKKFKQQYNLIYIFGTGPSLSSLNIKDLEPGLFIATNSMVVNEKLMEEIRPPLIVASDPIFHAGPSRYAEKFREKLFTCMKRYGSYFVFPMRDSGVWETHTPPDLKDRLIGVPLVNEGDININMDKTFMTSTTSNVMTLLLLPVAATLRKTIYLAGFDGRPISENNYYWSHDKNNQINEEMESVKLAHPGFFNIDFNDYYFEHHTKLLEYLSFIIHKTDIQLVNLTLSHLPALSALPSKPENTPPVISLIMACYNPLDFVNETIRSVLTQTYNDFEFIIIDDGSDKSFFEKIQVWAERDQRIQIFHKKNGGVSSARNFGLEKARGRYIAFIDDDDLLFPDSFEKRINSIQNSKSLCASYGKVQLIDDEGNPIGEYGGDDILGFDHFTTFPIHISGILVPSIFARQIRFENNVHNGEDWKYCAELARRGMCYLPTNSVTSAYRIHTKSVTGKNLLKHTKALLPIIDWLETDFWGYGFYPTINQVGLNPIATNRERINRILTQLFVALCISNHSEIRPIVRMIEAKVARFELPDQNCIDSLALNTISRISQAKPNSIIFFEFISKQKNIIMNNLKAVTMPLVPVFQDRIIATFKKIIKKSCGSDQLQKGLNWIIAPPFSYFSLPIYRTLYRIGPLRSILDKFVRIASK